MWKLIPLAIARQRQWRLDRGPIWQAGRQHSAEIALNDVRQRARPVARPLSSAQSSCDWPHDRDCACGNRILGDALFHRLLAHAACAYCGEIVGSADAAV